MDTSIPTQAPGLSSASATERSLRPAATIESYAERAESASSPEGGSLSQISLGDTLRSPAGRLVSDDLAYSQDGLDMPASGGETLTTVALECKPNPIVNV